MSRGATVFLVLAALLAVGAYVFLQRMASPNSPRVGDALFDFGSDDIRSIVITNGETVTEIRRTDDGWQIAPEPVDRASGEFVARVLEVARSTPVLDRIPASEAGDDLGSFGLKKSRQRLDFRGDGLHSLQFGKDTADESRMYVRFDDEKDVLVVSEELAELVFRDREDYRDRRVSHLRPARIERFLIRRPDGEMEVRIEAGAWRIVRPYRAAADEEAVAAFLGRLLGTGVIEFVADSSAQGSSAVPGDGGLVVELFAEGEARPEVLRFARAAGDGGGVVATSSARAGAFLVPAEAARLVEAAPGTLRDRAVARINADLVDQISVARGDATVVLRRSGEGWTDGAKAVPAEVVALLLEKLATLEVSDAETATADRLEQAGLTPPAARVTFSSIVSENTPEAAAGAHTVAEILLAAPDAEGRVAVHVEGEPEFGRVSAAILEALPTAP